MKFNRIIRYIAGLALLTAIMIAIAGAAPAAEALEIAAPGGGEFDFESNVAKYYADGDQLVEAHWSNYTFLSEYIEYNRDSEIVKGHGKVTVTQNPSKPRILHCNEFSYDRRSDYLTTSGNVRFNDPDSTLSGERFGWDHKNDSFTLEEQPKFTYQDWTVRGSRMDGQIEKGLVNVSGPAEATNGDISARGGKIVFNRAAGKLTVQDKPVLVRNKTEMTATEIVYDLKTKKVSAVGPVQSRMLEDEKH